MFVVVVAVYVLESSFIALQSDLDHVCKRSFCCEQFHVDALLVDASTLVDRFMLV